MSVSSVSPTQQQSVPYESAPRSGGTVMTANGTPAPSYTPPGPAAPYTPPAASSTPPNAGSPSTAADLLSNPPAPQTRIDFAVDSCLIHGMQEKKDKDKMKGLLMAEIVALKALPPDAQRLYEQHLNHTMSTGEMPNIPALNAQLTNASTQAAAQRKNGEPIGPFTTWYLDAFFLIAQQYNKAMHAQQAVPNVAKHKESPAGMMSASVTQQQQH